MAKKKTDDPGTTDNGKRQFKRASVLWQATLNCGNEPLDCQIYNVSPGGAKLRLAEPLTRFTQVQLDGRRFGKIPARVVWHQDDWIGLSFLDTPDKVAHALSDVLPAVAA